MNDFQKQLNDLKLEIDNLKSSTTLPLDVVEAMRVRLADSLTYLRVTNTSSTASTIHNKAVNEAGSSSYSVLNVPDGYLDITIDGVVKHVAYWNS